jgi:hypothetical protein
MVFGVKRLRIIQREFPVLLDIGFFLAKYPNEHSGEKREKEHE